MDSDVESAKAILERSSSDFPDSVGDVMCHPLCTCSKCSDVSFSTNGVPAQRKRSVVSLTQVAVKIKSEFIKFFTISQSMHS